MYSRFRALENYGEEENKRIRGATAAVVGLGATGSVIAEHLARHGVDLILIDRDYLEEKDLYSSNLYTREDTERGLPKAVAAEKNLTGPGKVDSHVESLGSGNISTLDGADIILDGTDNLDTRFLINEYSKKESTPWIYTASLATRGYSMFFDEKCFSCVFDKTAGGRLETCETAGILREISSITAAKSSLKAIKYLAGREVEENLELIPSGDSLEVESDGCGTCQEQEFPYLNSGKSIGPVCGENRYMIEKDISEDAGERLKNRGETLADNRYLTRVEIDGRELTVFRSGRAVVEARDAGHAEQRLSEILG